LARKLCTILYNEHKLFFYNFKDDQKQIAPLNVHQ